MLKNIKLKKFKDNEKIIIMVLVLCQKCLTFLQKCLKIIKMCYATIDL